MAVELRILSGARQGERVELDSREFRVGDSSDCDVQFDPGTDSGVRGRCLLFRMEDDGWRVKNVGAGQAWVNQSPVSGPTAVRSSDVIRMSELGPDFSFAILARRSQTAPDVLASPPVPAAPTPSSAPTPQAPSNINEPSPPIAAPPQRPVAIPWPWVALGLACFATILLLLRPFRSASVVTPESANKSAASPTGTSSAADQSQLDSSATSVGAPVTSPSDQTKAESPLGRGSTPDTRSEDATLSGKPAGKNGPEVVGDIWKELAEKSRGGVVALAVEDAKGGGLWTVGTACAVGQNALLTSASIACQLEVFRQDGWKVLVLSPEFKIREPVKTISVHVGFVKLAGQPQQQVFFDLAILTVDGKMPNRCELAPASASASLGKQSRVGIMGIAQFDPEREEEPQPLGRFDLLIPEIIPGSVVDVMQLPGGPEAPRLLVLTKDIPGGLEGSPIFDTQGKVVAVYTGPIQPSANSPAKLRVAPLVGPVLEWLERPDPELWVTPPVIQQPAAKAGVKP